MKAFLSATIVPLFVFSVLAMPNHRPESESNDGDQNINIGSEFDANKASGEELQWNERHIIRGADNAVQRLYRDFKNFGRLSTDDADESGLFNSW